MKKPAKVISIRNTPTVLKAAAEFDAFCAKHHVTKPPPYNFGPRRTRKLKFDRPES